MTPSRSKKLHAQAAPSLQGARATPDRAGEKDLDRAWAIAAQELEADIEAGRFEEGARLPTEAELCRRLHVNRHSLRRAIDSLVKKGSLRRISHVGSFVSPKRIRFQISSDDGANEGLQRSGLTRGHHLLSRRTCLPPTAVARRLGVAQRTEVIEVIHLSIANNEPFSHVTTWLPADRFRRVGEIMEAAGDVRQALAQIGITGVRRKAVLVTSRRVSKQEARLLKLPSTARVIVLDSLSVDRSGEPTHVSQCVVEGSRVELEIEF